MWRDGRVIAGEHSSDVEKFPAKLEEIIAILRRLPPDSDEDAYPAIGCGDVEVFREEDEYYLRSVQSGEQRVCTLEEAEQAFRKVMGEG